MFKIRDSSKNTREHIQTFGFSALQSAILANRDLNATEMPTFMRKDIPHVSLLKNAMDAGDIIANAILNNVRIGILTDYDVDGVSSNALLQQAILSIFNYDPEKLFVLVGHRMQDGYGLSSGLCAKILKIDQHSRPELIITADCGSSDEERIKILSENNIQVVVTDHHRIDVPPPSASVVVNPHQHECNFPDKTIAGVTVAWYVMWATYIRLQSKGLTLKTSLTYLWDYVALGTVADCVSMKSGLNRMLVNEGLKLINKRIRPCWDASMLKTNNSFIDEGFLGFQLGPRINARSRMDDPYLAIDFLSATTVDEAIELFNVLTENNQTRKQTEKNMLGIALSMINDNQHSHCNVIYHQSFHPGVQGIVASRITEKTGKPSVVFSPAANGEEITGSGRGVPHVDLAAILNNIKTNAPGIVIKGGGHDGAIGLHIMKDRLLEFTELFNSEIITMLNNEPLEPIIYTDGDITQLGPLTMSTVKEIEELKPFGMKFPEPMFLSVFTINTAVLFGKNKEHVKLSISKNGYTYSAKWFGAAENIELLSQCNRGITLCYSPEISSFGEPHLELNIRAAKF